MGFWGTGAMHGDRPLDLRGDISRAADDKLTTALESKDDADVFAAAHIAMDLHESDVLGFDYHMFAKGSDSLADVIRNRVANVPIAEEWGTDEHDGNVLAREKVRRVRRCPTQLLIRLDSLKARFQAERDALKARDAARNS